MTIHVSLLSLSTDEGQACRVSGNSCIFTMSEKKPDGMEESKIDMVLEQLSTMNRAFSELVDRQKDADKRL